jgi:DNA-binding MarR family transcriptional regulator
MPFRERGEQLDHVMTQLFVAVESVRAFYERCAAEVDLTPPQARVLLLAGQPCSQRDLAVQFCCDASNIVGIVDRLEQRGLVERMSTPTDRRVKQVMLTPSGCELRDRFQALLQAQVPVLSGLDDDQLDQLGHFLDRFSMADVSVAG